MKDRKVRILGELIIILTGVVLLLLFEQNSLIKSVGIGLVTAGIASLLFEGILKEEFINELKKTLSPNVKILGLRQNMDNIYLELFRSARKQIDIMALTSEGMMKTYGKHLENKIMTESCDIRILILNYDSKLWDYRIKEEGGSFSRRILEEISKKVLEFYKGISNSIAKKVSSNEEIKGSLAVKLHENIPYSAYFRADEKLIVGFYYSYTTGNRSHAIEVSPNSDLFNSLERHFDAIWNKSKTKELINISYRGIKINNGIHIGK